MPYNKRATKNAKSGGSKTPFEASVEAPEILDAPYSEDELEYRRFLLGRLETARNIREQKHDEFNGMTYSERYIANMKAGNSFTPPRKNPEDTSVVTGTTREKKLAIVNAVLNLNFTTEFHAFDENNLEDQELGQAMADCVEQANKVEGWDDKKIFAYNELADQGDVFIEELFVDETRIDKKRARISDVKDEDYFKTYTPSKAIKTTFSGCKRNIISGLQVYLGNIKIRDASDQPFLFTKEVIAYEKAKALYGHLARFQNVQRDYKQLTSDDPDSHWGMNWRLGDIEKDMVEIIKYQDKWNDEYQIILNGVMMLPVGFAMPWEHGEYNIVQGRLEPISAFFAYSKSIPDKTKLDQEIIDEMYRLAVLKTQKSFMPPIANYSANILTKSMFLPGKVNNNLMKGDIEVLGGNPDAYSMKPSEFQMIQMIKGFIDEKSVSSMYQGIAPDRTQTATEVSTVMQQAKQKLGLVIFGFIQLHMNLDTIRLYNVLENYTKDQGEKVSGLTGKIEKKYRAITVPKEIGNRGTGMKRIEFTEEKMSPDKIYDLEEGITRDEAGKPLSKNPPPQPMQYVQISPSALRSIKYRWYAETIPSEKESSYAEQVKFMDQITKAAQLFGIESLNLDYLKQQWATKNKLNPNYMFVKNPVLPPQEEVDAMEESPLTKVTRSAPDGTKQAARQGY